MMLCRECGRPDSAGHCDECLKRGGLRLGPCRIKKDKPAKYSAADLKAAFEAAMIRKVEEVRGLAVLFRRPGANEGRA
jgi:hypothetical protein